MAQRTYTEVFSETSLEQFIKDLKDARIDYDNEEEAAVAASLIFTWLGIIGGPAGVCVTAGILTSALAYYYDTVQNTITTAIEVLEDYKDYLENNSLYDLVKLEVTCDVKEVDNTTYLIPVDFRPLAVHLTNPPGWEMI